jgi:hypothetical protein
VVIFMLADVPSMASKLRLTSKVTPLPPPLYHDFLRLSGPQHEGAIKKEYNSKFQRCREQVNLRADFMDLKVRYIKEKRIHHAYIMSYSVTLT